MGRMFLLLGLVCLPSIGWSAAAIKIPDQFPDLLNTQKLLQKLTKSNQATAEADVVSLRNLVLDMKKSLDCGAFPSDGNSKAACDGAQALSGKSSAQIAVDLVDPNSLASKIGLIHKRDPSRKMCNLFATKEFFPASNGSQCGVFGKIEPFEVCRNNCTQNAWDANYSIYGPNYRPNVSRLGGCWLYAVEKAYQDIRKEMLLNGVQIKAGGPILEADFNRWKTEITALLGQPNVKTEIKRCPSGDSIEAELVGNSPPANGAQEDCSAKYYFTASLKILISQYMGLIRSELIERVKDSYFRTQMSFHGKSLVPSACRSDNFNEVIHVDVVMPCVRATPANQQQIAACVNTKYDALLKEFLNQLFPGVMQ